MSDDALADAWLGGARFDGGVTHRQHLRIAWVLHRRHGAKAAEALLIAGTRRACEVHGCPEKFDRELTARWSRKLAALIERDGLGRDAAEFIEPTPS